MLILLHTQFTIHSMMRSLPPRFLLPICFLLGTIGIATTAQAQEEIVQPYFGAGLNILPSDYAGNTHSIGFGVEAGVKYSFVYVGLEYGVCSLVNSISTRDAPTPLGNFLPPDSATSMENYYGVHIGVRVWKGLAVGVVFLKSTQSVMRYYGEAVPIGREMSYSWFNVGPDLRLTIGDHAIVGCAYTIQRGLKFGGDYLF